MARTTSTARATRENILHAAAQIVTAQGVATLTLEAVAHTAGVSKGGLLYHFPSKDALIGGMIEALLDEFEQELALHLQSEPDLAAPGAWLRAYTATWFATDSADVTASAGLLAAVATNPQLLAPARARFAQWQERATHDGVDPALATLIRLALDGLLLADMLQLAPPEAGLRQQLGQLLHDLATPVTP